MGHLDEDTLRKREEIIVGEYKGIYPAYEAFYIHSIIYAAERSQAAFQRYDEAVFKAESAAIIVAAVQEALTHSAALSRFFWPMKPVKKNISRLTTERGKRLREAFQIDDKSPLMSRKLRNSFEHFDNDLDCFLLYDRSGCVFPGPLVGTHELADDAVGNIFKLVDPQYGICILLGQSFEFEPIRVEVQRVLNRAQEMDANGCRL